jgi:hypothetical protein
MPFSLSKKAYDPTNNQRVELTQDERALLYGDQEVEPAYDYDPLKHDWASIDWEAYECQFELLCKKLDAIAQTLVQYESTNPELSSKIASYKGTYSTTINQLSAKVRFHGTNNAGSQYASGDKPGKPPFFAEFKSALEVIVLDLADKLKKLEEGSATEIDKDDALSRLHGAVQEAAMCNEGAHAKFMSMKEEIEQNKSIKGLVSQKLNAIFVQIGADYCKKAFKRIEMELMDPNGLCRADLDSLFNQVNLRVTTNAEDTITEYVKKYWHGQNPHLRTTLFNAGRNDLITLLDDWKILLGNETHAPDFFKNLAHAMNLFPPHCGFVPYQLVPVFQPAVNEEGKVLFRLKDPGLNSLKLFDVDLDEFKEKFDRLFNADAVVDLIADNLFTDIVTPYRNNARKDLANKVNLEGEEPKEPEEPIKYRERMNELADNITDVLKNIGIKHDYGFFDDQLIVYNNEVKTQKDYEDLVVDGQMDVSQLKISYQVRSDLEVIYWSRVFAISALEAEGLVTGVEREPLCNILSNEKNELVMKVRSSEDIWYENVAHELIYPDLAVNDWNEEDLEKLIDNNQSFYFLNVIRETLKQSGKHPRLLAKCGQLREDAKFEYHCSQMLKGNPHFAFDTIEDLNNFMMRLEEVNNSLLPRLALSLQVTSRDQINAIFVHAMNMPGKPEHRLIAKNVLNKLDQIKDNLPLGIQFPTSRIYLSRALIETCFKLGAEEARDALPDSWFGSLPTQLPENFFGMRDYTSLTNLKPQQLDYADLFEKYPPIILNLFKGVPEDCRSIIGIIFMSLSNLDQKGERKNLIAELWRLSFPQLKYLVKDFSTLETLCANIRLRGSEWLKGADPKFNGNVTGILHSVIKENPSNFILEKFIHYLKLEAKLFNGLLEGTTVELVSFFISYAKKHMSKQPSFERNMNEVILFILDINNHDNKRKKPSIYHLNSIFGSFSMNSDGRFDYSNIIKIIEAYLPKVNSYILLISLANLMDQMIAGSGKVFSLDLQTENNRKMRLQHNIDQCNLVEEDRSNIIAYSIEEFYDLYVALNDIDKIASNISKLGNTNSTRKMICSGVVHTVDKVRIFAKRLIDAINKQPLYTKWVSVEMIASITDDQKTPPLERLAALPESWKTWLNCAQLRALLIDQTTIAAFCDEQASFNYAISDDPSRFVHLMKPPVTPDNRKRWIAMAFEWLKQTDVTTAKIEFIASGIAPGITTFDEIYEYSKKLTEIVPSSEADAKLAHFMQNLSAGQPTITLTRFADDLRDSREGRPVGVVNKLLSAILAKSEINSPRELYIILTKFNGYPSISELVKEKLAGYGDMKTVIPWVVEELLGILSHNKSSPTRVLRDWGVVSKDSPSFDEFFPKNQEPIQTLYWLRVFVCLRFGDISSVEKNTPHDFTIHDFRYHGLFDFQWVEGEDYALPTPKHLQAMNLDKVLSQVNKENSLLLLSVIFPGRRSVDSRIQSLLKSQKLASNVKNLLGRSRTAAALILLDDLDDLRCLLDNSTSLSVILHNLNEKHKRFPIFNKIRKLISESLKDSTQRDEANRLLSILTVAEKRADLFLTEAFMVELVTMDDLDEARARMPKMLHFGSVGEAFPTFRNYQSIENCENPQAALEQLVSLTPLMIHQYLREVPDDKWDIAFERVFKLISIWSDRPEIVAGVQEKLVPYLNSVDRLTNIFASAKNIPAFNIDTLADLAFEKHLNEFTAVGICHVSTLPDQAILALLKKFFERKSLDSLREITRFIPPAFSSVYYTFFFEFPWVINLVNESSDDERIEFFKAMLPIYTGRADSIKFVQKISGGVKKDRVIAALLPAVVDFTVYEAILAQHSEPDSVCDKVKRDALKLAYNKSIIEKYEKYQKNPLLVIECREDLKSLHKVMDRVENNHGHTEYLYVMKQCLLALDTSDKKRISEFIIDSIFDQTEDDRLWAYGLYRELKLPHDFYDPIYFAEKIIGYNNTNVTDSILQGFPDVWIQTINAEQWVKILPDYPSFARYFRLDGLARQDYWEPLKQFIKLQPKLLVNLLNACPDISFRYTLVAVIDALREDKDKIFDFLSTTLIQTTNNFHRLFEVRAACKEVTDQLKLPVFPVTKYILELIKAKPEIFGLDKFVLLIKNEGITQFTLDLLRVYLQGKLQLSDFDMLISHPFVIQKQFIDCFNEYHATPLAGRIKSERLAEIINALTASSDYSKRTQVFDKFIIDIIGDGRRVEYLHDLFTRLKISGSLMIKLFAANEEMFKVQSIREIFDSMLRQWLSPSSDAEQKRLTECFSPLIVELNIQEMPSKDPFFNAFMEIYIKRKLNYPDFPRGVVVDLRRNFQRLICYYDKEKDLYIDWQEAYYTDNKAWALNKPIILVENRILSSNRYCILVDNNLMKTRYFADLSTEAFNESYFTNFDKDLLPEARPMLLLQPAYTERLRDHAEKATKDYLEKTYYPGILKLYSVHSLDSNFHPEIITSLINLCPETEFQRSLLEFNTVVNRLLSNENIFESMTLPQMLTFFSWMNRFESTFTSRFMRMANFYKIAQRINALTEDKPNAELSVVLSSFFLLNIDSLRKSLVKQEAVVHLLLRLAPLNYTDLRILPFYKEPFPDSLSLGFTSFAEPINIMVNKDSIENILTEIHVVYWPTVLRYAMQLPDTFPDFDFEFLTPKGDVNAKISTCFTAYKQGKSFIDKLKDMASSSFSTPSLMHDLQRLCENHTLQEKELPAVKKIFAQHFAQLFRENKVGDAFVNDPVNKAVFTPAKNK